MLWVSLAVSECCVIVCYYICAHLNIITPQDILRNVFGKQVFFRTVYPEGGGSSKYLPYTKLALKDFDSILVLNMN